MKIYSENTFIFVSKMEAYLKEIISKETQYKLRKTRFEYQGYTYPIHIVVFENNHQLGYFDPNTYQIGLNAALMYQAKEIVLKNILRHELAHYICFIENKMQDSPHGAQFKSVCERYEWKDSVSKASIDINLENNFEGDLVSEKLITRIKNLLKLAESDNPHEAQLATLKANQLLLKHNISKLEVNKSSKTLYVEEVYKAKRRNAKMAVIYEILKHFLVKPVFIYGQGQTTLEVSGSKENIELAKYVTDFLDNELERLWKEATNLKGTKAKNSFFLGIARGYDEKAQNITADFSDTEKMALVNINNHLDSQIKKVYRRLSSTSSSNAGDAGAFSKGKEKGKSLNINTAIKNKAKTFLLNWR